MSEQAKAYVSLIPSTKGWERQVGDQIDGPATKAGRNAGTKAGKAFGGSFGSSAKSLIGVGAGLAIGGGVLNFLKASNSEARESQKVSAQTAQVIKSTGGAARVSVADINALSGAISAKVGIDDEAIQSGANLLLTFTNIRNEAGKGNDVFSQATQTLTDMSAALGTDVKGSAIQLGKALNDPVKGVTALQRVGVTFTAQQKKQIKTLVDSGKTLDAQKIILRELGKEFGGSAAAQATAGDKLNVSFKNLEEQVGTALLPTVDKLAVLLTTKVVPAVSNFLTGMQDGTGAGGDFADVLTDIYKVGKGVVDIVDGLPGPVKKFGAEALIATFAVSKITGGLASGRDSLTRWNAETDKGARSLRALGSGLTNLAGAGGFILVADGAKKAGTSMGTLELAAGGALSGAALGAFAGPEGAAIGAGIGGTIGLIHGLTSETKSSGKAALDSIGSYKDYATTLDGVSASTTAATRAMVLQRLEKSGLLDATRQLGLSDRQAVNAVLGNATARQRLTVALREGHGLTLAQRDALIKETGAVASSRLEQLRKNVALAQNKTQLEKARTALRAFMREPASKRVTIRSEDARQSIRDLRTGLLEVIALAGKPIHFNPVSPNVLDPTGLTTPPRKPRRRRALGGPVTANQTYLVGERGPELFTSSQAGRIASNNQLQQTAGPISASGQRMRLVVGGREFDAYMEQIADSRVDAARAEDGALERSFG